MSILSKQFTQASAVGQPKDSHFHEVRAVSGKAASDQSVAVQSNEMPADIALGQTVALTNTTDRQSTDNQLERDQTAKSQTPEQQQRSLQLLSTHPLLYDGDLFAAARVITTATAAMLGAARVSLWQVNNGTLQSLDRYDRGQDQHTQATGLLPENYKAYLEGTGTAETSAGCTKPEGRSEIVVENTASAIDSQQASPDGAALDCLTQQELIFCEPGALLEVMVRHQGQTVGFLWCEHSQAHRWTASEQTVVLSVSLLAAAAMNAVAQTALSSELASVLDKQQRQLKRETIEREQAERAWQESQRFIQGIIDASTNILYVDNFVDGSNIYISRWIMNVLGYEAHEVQKLGPQYLEKLVHADEKAQMISERKKLSAINDGEVVENEYRFRHRQGNWRWLLCRETVFQRDEDGQPTQVFGTATDITKRKHAEVALKEFNRELERLASMDGLTQVANRRSFDRYLKQEWENIGSGRSALSLILCDIDYFKSFNDTYGHQAGDVCLRRVAQAIERAVKRSTDLVARYGGEEFAVILPNTGTEGVKQVAQEVRREIQQLDIPHSQSGVSQCITLSLGIAVVTSTENGHPDMLVAAADQGLYQAKYEGRDRFCIGELDIPQSSQP